jgi:hypothetical protein
LTVRSIVLITLAACGTASPPPTTPPLSSATAASSEAPTGTSSPTSTSTATTASTTTATPSGPPPTGGSVLVGDINAPKGFDPKPVVSSMSGELVGCFNQARAGNPSLHGKLTLHITVNEAGAVLSVDADPGGRAYDPVLVQCIGDAMKTGAHFPKPGGTATVTAPLVFRP